MPAVVLVALALTGCTAAPEPDPEAFWTELQFYTDLPDRYEDRSVTEGQAVCTRLVAGAQPRNEHGADHGADHSADLLAAMWQEWVAEMGPADAGFFWETAVEHLCPDRAQTLRQVQAVDGLEPQVAP